MDVRGSRAVERQREPGLVIAPHPFFPSRSCLRGRLTRHAALFDAVEYNGMFTAEAELQPRGRAVGAAHGKPIVGNGDVHRLEQLGTTYSLVDAEPDPDAICDAIRNGDVRVKAHPHSVATAAGLMFDLFVLNRGSNRWQQRQPSADAAF